MEPHSLFTNWLNVNTNHKQQKSHRITKQRLTANIPLSLSEKIMERKTNKGASRRFLINDKDETTHPIILAGKIEKRGVSRLLPDEQHTSEKKKGTFPRAGWELKRLITATQQSHKHRAFVCALRSARVLRPPNPTLLLFIPEKYKRDQPGISQPDSPHSC